MKKATRLVSWLLAASMTMGLCPVSAFAVYTGGGTFPDTVSVQETDAENDADDTHYTQVFNVANAASTTDDTVTFADAVNSIKNNPSGNYLIKLTEDVTLPATTILEIHANTTILGEDHTIHFGSVPLEVVGSGIVLNLGRSGYDKTLTISDGTGGSIIAFSDSSSCVLNLYSGVTFKDNRPGSAIIFAENSVTINMYGNSCIKAANESTIISGGDDGGSPVLNMYGTSCLDGSSTAKIGYAAAQQGTLNMYGQSSIKNCKWYAFEVHAGTMNDSSLIDNCGGSETKDWGCVRVGRNGSFTMNGGSITNCHTPNGGGVYITDGGTFTMNGGSITKCSAASNGGGVYVTKDATFILSGGSIADCSAYNGGGVFSAGTFTMSSGSITGCSASYGGGVYISDAFSDESNNGTFTMNGGSITDCSAGSGGGILVDSNAAFTMKDGSITGCSAKTYSGGGIYSSGTITMDGGSITSCSADTYGGGVYVRSGSLSMNAGSITKCSATYGGGVYVASQYDGSLSLNAGSITGCSATYGGGIYLSSGASLTSRDGFILCNNTAASNGADARVSAGNQLPSAASMNAVYNADGKGHAITGWYEDRARARYSPENYSKEISNDDIRSSYYNLVASYRVDNIHTITIADDDEGFTPGWAYRKDETTGDETSITGTVPGKKVYLRYENEKTLDRWTAKPDTLEIHPATEDEDAWFVMPDYDVTITCADYYVPPVIKTDLGSSIIYPNEETAFTLSITLNNEPDGWALGSLYFDQSEAIEELYYFDVRDNTDSNDGTWRKLDVDSSTGEAIFAYHDEDIDRELELDSVTECKFRVTFNKKGSYTLSATLLDTDDDEGNPVMGTMDHPVPFTVGYALTLSDGVTLDDLKVDDDDPEYDADGDLITKEGNELTFKKPDDADDDIIYKFVDSSGNETELEPDEDGTYTVTLPTGGGTIKLGKKSSPEPDISTDDSVVGAVGTDAAVIIGGAAIGAAAYLVGTQVWMETHLPDGVIPANRQQLALMLWNAADRPQPQSTALYSDIAAADTDAQAAARWCVEQGLMKDYAEGASFKPSTYVFRPQAISAWYELEKLLNEQQ